MPNDHVRTLIELLKPVGPDLARRWVAALMLAPAAEREGIVEAVERRMIELYDAAGGDDAGDADGADPMMHMTVSERVREDGSVERVEKSYSPAPEKGKPSRGRARRGA